MNDEHIILQDSQEAANYRDDLRGWVSRSGHFFGDNQWSEQAARYDGCTHTKCSKCREPTPKGYAVCKQCRDAADLERYRSMPRAKWDGEAMLYSERLDKFYGDPLHALDDLDYEYTSSKEIDEALRLVICEPVYVRPLDDSYCIDQLPDDGDMPDEVLAAMEAFNAAVKGIVLSWEPGKTALEW